MSQLLLVFAMSLTAATALTGLVRRYTLHRAMIDVPNRRSSHTTPRPRGGGLAIATVVLGGIVAGALAGLVPMRVVAALAGGGTLVAAIGWLDDRGGVRPLIRILVHLAATGWALAWLGGLPVVRVGASQLALGYGGAVLGGLVIIWGINLYNFMDGIDGLAGGEAVVVGSTAAVLLHAGGFQGLACAAAVIGGASGGFLYWNWSPAKIFMGDVGSGFLGFLFATLAVASENSGGLPLLSWSLLLGVFVFDATVTLVRRLVGGEQVHKAHCRHAYQRAVQSGWSHGRVTGMVLVLTTVLSLLVLVAARAPERLGLMLLLGAGMLAVVYMALERRQPMWDARTNALSSRDE